MEKTKRFIRVKVDDKIDVFSKIDELSHIDSFV